jgi:predicted DNA-binding protein (MmcQ/YjbR family)
MNIESVREYCLSKQGADESFPFGETALVFKVAGKMFALVSLDSEPSINLKCDPEKAIDLREQYSFVVAGYHMNKQHWNTVYLDYSLPDKLLKEWIDHSYDLVTRKISKREKKKTVRK